MKSGIFKISTLLTLMTLVVFLGCKKDEEEIPPASTVAKFEYTSDNDFFAPTTIAFTNTSIEATSYSWDFGNGETSTEKNPTVMYEDPGVYTVTLTATGNTTDTESEDIVIKDPNAGKSRTLYYSDRNTGKIHFIKLDGEAPVVQDFSWGGLYKPYGICIDYDNEKVYVSDVEGIIYKCDLDGENPEIILNVNDNPEVDFPYGIVVVDGKIYWGIEGGLMKANIDGTNIEWAIQMTATPEMPIGLAYDYENDKLYFTNDKYDYSGGVYRCNLDGSEMELLVPDMDAGGIAIDLEHGKMYFSDWFNGLYMSNLDGSNLTVINGDLGGETTFVWGMALDEDAGYLYVSDKITEVILRSQLDGSGSENWVSGIYPHAMAIDTYR
jgi:sugar lactone lactonase YvrE